MRFSSLVPVGIGIGIVILSVSSLAEIPQVISYQGKVTDSGGVPVPDGDYTMRFRTYDDPTGGTLEWDSGNRTVVVSGGIFNVMLGESPQPALNLGFAEDLWLLVTFDGDDQTPRKRLGSVGYAYMASGLVAGTEVIGSVTTGTAAALKATNTATTGLTRGLWGESASTSGDGVFGWATATTGAAFGVRGWSASTDGYGVCGVALSTTGATNGVYGRSTSMAGTGVYGSATATTGAATGVYGESASPYGRGVYGYASASTSGDGVYGEAPYTGVRGKATGTDGAGVDGFATATTGYTYGVYGWSASTSGRGVQGYASGTTGTNYGGRFLSSSTSGRGCYGWATATTGTTYGGAFKSSSPDGYGVWGKAEANSGINYGVYGESASSSGRGVYGIATATTATTTYGGKFASASQSGRAVYGHASHTSGTSYGGKFDNNSTNGTGVYGLAYATTGTNYGVCGETDSPSGYGVYYVGGLGGTGLMTSIVETSQGPTSLDVHTTAGNWVEDFGEARLVDGRARVELDLVFLETVTIDETNPMHVFVQPYDEGCVGLVVERGLTGFHVVKPSDDQVSGMFSYRVVAKKKGFEGRRLEVCEAARTDSYLYPELRERELKGHHEERARLDEERRLWGEERSKMEEGQAERCKVRLPRDR